MPATRKYIDLKEFREFGFLQEVNRKFLHPLGLALEFSEDTATGAVEFTGIWDARDDPEGIAFEWDAADATMIRERAERVWRLRHSKFEARDALFEGDGTIQPLPET